MDLALLQTIWYLLIAVLFLGFFIVEGFDYGVGILSIFVAKTDIERRQVMNAIGPVWEANEVWLITAGGAMFAAFPHWYATMFSGFYLPLVLMLFGLILRGVSFEFRSKSDSKNWRGLWDFSFFLGSAIPALLFGVAFANLILGIPIDQNKHYVGGFFNLLNPYALVGGLISLSMFTLQGALFLNLKVDGAVLARVKSFLKTFWIVVLVLGLAGILYSYFATKLLFQNPVYLVGSMVLAIALFFGIKIMVDKGHNGWAFFISCLTIILGTAAFFIGLFPQVMVSSLNFEWSLTLYNASSSQYTLQTMFTVAIICVPIVLAYQIWTFYIFRKRITGHSELEY